MAKISGSEKNSKLIEQVKKAIETIITTSKALDEEMVSSIDGKKIVTDEIEHYKKLVQVKNILDFSEKAESELFAFEEVYVEKSKQEKLFELANDSELGIEFPSAFGQYGEIPGTEGLTCPRPKSMLETYEGYEAYLKQYYKAADIDPTFDENGVRLPYPHEKYIWKKGQATVSKEKDYVSSYYKEYKEWKSKLTKGEELEESGTAGAPEEEDDLTEDKGKKTGKTKKTEPTDDDTPELSDEERSARAKDRTAKRKGLDRRKYPKDKKTIGDYLKAPFRKVDEADKTLSNGKNWPKIKRLLVGAAVVVGAGILLQTAGLPLLSGIWTGLTEWPFMITSAISGVATKGGATIALSAAERIAMGLIGVAVPAGVFGIVRGCAKRWDAAKKKAEEEWEREHGGIDDDTDDIDDPDIDKDKGKKKGTDKGTGDDKKKTPKPKVNVPEGSLNDKITFIKNALSKINDDLDIAQEELRALDTSVDSAELKEERLKALSTKIKNLKTKRDAYMEELVKLVSDAEFEAAKEQPAAIHTSGGMNK